jgi:hypothetical protein
MQVPELDALNSRFHYTGTIRTKSEPGRLQRKIE